MTPEAFFLLLIDCVAERSPETMNVLGHNLARYWQPEDVRFLACAALSALSDEDRAWVMKYKAGDNWADDWPDAFAEILGRAA